MIQKHTIGFMPIQKNAQNVKLQLKKMADVIMLYVEIRFEHQILSNFMTKNFSRVGMNFVGSVSQHGHHTDQHFTIVTDIMKLKVLMLDSNKKTVELLLKDIFFIITDIIIMLNHSRKKENFKNVSRKK